MGKITFDSSTILGKGCEGTFVYRGRFDNRDVAVKRVLASCFSIADREVELLRESDEHPNVIRYFCMEQDSQFRYIALELCSATLLDYVEGKFGFGQDGTSKPLDPLTMLRHATQGLNHLHNLDIVHRDIKPHNVLISLPGTKGDVRAMISDFGLCKKLNPGKLSFSRRSGVAGTEGWIAPEMMTGMTSTTCSVDIFSLGCVFHFVLSKGIHPFGASYKRQGNILSSAYDLSALGGDCTAKSLIEKMISSDSKSRPTSIAILKHPLFWSKQKVLAFLQEVSDRVDKEDADSAILLALERNRHSVVMGNWQELLDGKVREDLRKPQDLQCEVCSRSLESVEKQEAPLQRAAKRNQGVLRKGTRPVRRLLDIKISQAFGALVARDALRQERGALCPLLRQELRFSAGE